MAFDPITAGTSLLGSVFDSVFGDIDKGHWAGSLYIPGDLQSRYNTVRQKYLPKYNLLITDVNWDDIDLILKTPDHVGGWQGAVERYLQQVVKTKKSATINSPDPTVDISNPINTPKQTVGGTSTILPANVQSYLPLIIGFIFVGILLSRKG